MNVLEETPVTDWWLCDCAIGNAVIEVGRWPRWMRRAYILTLPFSVCLHMIVIVILAMGVLVTIPIDLINTARRGWK